jgi:hypothetical protein
MNPKEQYSSNKENIISIYSFSGDSTTDFCAFLTDFSDRSTSNWSSQEIYGRMDPIHTYKNTTRKISIAFDVPSYDIVESKNNYNNINTLMDALYPTYSDSPGKGDAVIGSPPFFKIRFSNLIAGDVTKIIVADNALVNSGLLGWIDSITFGPELDSGFFVENNEKLYPKLFKVSFTFNVIHEKQLGKYISVKEGEQRVEEAKQSTATPSTTTKESAAKVNAINTVGRSSKTKNKQKTTTQVLSGSTKSVANKKENTSKKGSTQTETKTVNGKEASQKKNNKIPGRA